MGLTIIEKILAAHSEKKVLIPGEIVDVKIDVRLARDFGGANVVKNLKDNKLVLDDSAKTFFTFDCNPTGSDQKYAANQQLCRVYARDNNIPVYDINSGIGTHLAIDKGLAIPGSTLVSTDSHANILAAIGAFGQGMGDRDIAAAWSKGSVWFKVPESIRINLTGNRPEGVHAKDIMLNLLKEFGASSLLGYAIELEGREVEKFSLDERITISSMATELGAIALFFTPSEEIIAYCSERSGKTCKTISADEDAVYTKSFNFDLESCFQAVALPGKPHDVVPLDEVLGTKIDSAFIGSCTNGRMEDMRLVAGILAGRKIAPGVVLKIVPATDEVWNLCLDEGLIKIFKDAGALFGNAGCAGCASGQIGQNGPGEITVSTGNRNFAGKQGRGEVYLVSPVVAAASAIAGHISSPDSLPETPSVFSPSETISQEETGSIEVSATEKKPTLITGKVWLIDEDNIDTDMIYHNQYLSVTELDEMGQYTFGNLKGWEDFAEKSEPGDIVITGKNFGAGSSRQQAVDCFKALKIQAILGRSFGAIYERNAINAGFPVLICSSIESLELEQRDKVSIDLEKGKIKNERNNKIVEIGKFSDVQMQIYEQGDLLRMNPRNHK